MKCFSACWCAAFCLVAVCGGVGVADELNTTLDELSPDRSQNGWKVSPYVWALSLEGEAGIDNVVADIDIDFSEAIDESDTLVAGMLWGTIDFDDISLFVSGTYVHIGGDEGSGSLGPVDISAEIDAKVSWLELGIQKELGVTGAGEGQSGIVWDLYGGGRVTYVELDLDLETKVFGAPILGVDDDYSEVWVEPFIGLGAATRLDDHWVVSMHGDVGGFGAGSDFAWHAMCVLAFTFELGDAVSAGYLGYRAISQDYDQGGFQWDVLAHGPMIGVAIKF